MRRFFKFLGWTLAIAVAALFAVIWYFQDPKTLTWFVGGAGIFMMLSYWIKEWFVDPILGKIDEVNRRVMHLDERLGRIEARIELSRSDNKQFWTMPGDHRQ